MKNFIRNMKIILMFFGVITLIVILTSGKNSNKDIVTVSKVEMKVSKEQALINQQKAKEEAEIERQKQEEIKKQKILDDEEKAKQEKIRIREIVIKEQDQDIEIAKKFIKDTELKLKTKYVKTDLIVEADGIKIVLDGIIRENASRKDDAIKYQYLIDGVVRKIVANNMEGLFMDNNQGYEIIAKGKDSKTLEFKYALMTKQTAYTLINKLGINEIAIKYGFTKVIFTDGYDHSFIYDF